MMQELEDLHRAIKEEVGKELADLTFTPAMRNRVLARLTERPRSRMTWLYPASAAAALILVLVTTWNGTHMGTKTERTGSTPESVGPNAATAAGPAGAGPQTGAKPPNPDGVTALADPSQDRGQKVGQTGQSDAYTSAPDANFTTDAPNAGVHGLNAQEQGPSPRTLGKMGALSVRAESQGPHLAILPGGRGVVSVAAGSVVRVDSAGATVWQVQMPGARWPEQVMITPGGKIAVVAENMMILLSADGATLESLQVAEPIRRMAWGTGDRLALVGDASVYTRQAPGQPLVTVAKAQVTGASFTPDGLLLLASPAGLAAYESGGARRWQVAPEVIAGTPDGKGLHPVDALLVSPDGKRILWGSRLLDQDGAPTATISEPALGQAGVGSLILRWEGEKLAALTWAGKVAWRWEAPGSISGLFAGEGDRIWVLIMSDDGARLQALQADSGRPTGKSQSLSGLPTEGVAANGQLFLRQSEELTVVHP